MKSRWLLCKPWEIFIHRLELHRAWQVLVVMLAMVIPTCLWCVGIVLVWKLLASGELVQFIPQGLLLIGPLIPAAGGLLGVILWLLNLHRRYPRTVFALVISGLVALVLAAPMMVALLRWVA